MFDYENFFSSVFILFAFFCWIAFLKDLHRYKSQFNFSGPRSKFIDFLLEKQLNDSEKGSDDNDRC